MDILDQPALAPPPGVTPNFENPPNLRHPELAVLQFVAATLVVAIRIYTKKFIIKKMLVEDYWLLAAWITFIGFQVIAFVLEDLPLGVHQWDMTLRRAIEYAKLFHISVGIYALVVIPLKVAIILQIRRIFTPTIHISKSQRGLRWVIDCFLILNVIFYLTLFLFQFLLCRPLEAAWNPFVKGVCLQDRLVMHIISASINTASDLTIMLLPQPVIWSLNMDRKKQLGLSAVFLVGSLACAASIVRLYHSVLLYSATDQSYRGALMGKWAEPELTLGFYVACLPVVPTFVKHMLAKPAVQRLFGFCCCLGAGRNKTLSDSQPSAAAASNHVATIGSASTDGSARSKKVVDEFDIEFAELTRPDSREGRRSGGSGETSGSGAASWEGEGSRGASVCDGSWPPQKAVSPV